MSEIGFDPEKKIALFQRKEVRRTIHNNGWWFVITDVVAVLTDSVDASDYLKKLRKRDPQLADAFKGGDKSPPLGLEFDTASASGIPPPRVNLYRHRRASRTPASSTDRHDRAQCQSVGVAGRQTVGAT